MVLLNGLAEQAESWFGNLPFWRRHFDVYTPNLLVYDGPALHRTIESGLPIGVDYLVEQLHHFLEAFVQTPPYHLVAASLGGKVAVEYAARYPNRIARLVLLCPSGMGDKERLPSWRASAAMILAPSSRACFTIRIASIRSYYAITGIVSLIAAGVWDYCDTVRGTMDHCVRHLLAELPQPVLLVAGGDDKIVDPKVAAAAAKLLPNGHFLCIPQCGHAPQMERPWLTNRLVLRFLTSAQPSTRPQVSEMERSNLHSSQVEHP